MPPATTDVASKGQRCDLLGQFIYHPRISHVHSRIVKRKAWVFKGKSLSLAMRERAAATAHAFPASSHVSPLSLK